MPDEEIETVLIEENPPKDEDADTRGESQENDGTPGSTLIDDKLVNK